MKISCFLEEFSLNIKNKNNDSEVIIAEEDKLESFDMGYKAGWDDSLLAQTDLIRKNEIELNQAISDLSFSQYAALDTASKHAINILKEILDTILPKMLVEVLQDKIISEIAKAIKDNLQPEVKILVNISQKPNLVRLNTICSDNGILVEGRTDIEKNCAKTIMVFDESFINLNEYTEKISEILMISFNNNETIKKLG